MPWALVPASGDAGERHGQRIDVPIDQPRVLGRWDVGSAMGMSEAHEELIAVGREQFQLERVEELGDQLRLTSRGRNGTAVRQPGMEWEICRTDEIILVRHGYQIAFDQKLQPSTIFTLTHTDAGSQQQEQEQEQEAAMAGASMRVLSLEARIEDDEDDEAVISQQSLVEQQIRPPADPQSMDPEDAQRSQGVFTTGMLEAQVGLLSGPSCSHPEADMLEADAAAIAQEMDTIIEAHRKRQRRSMLAELPFELRFALLALQDDLAASEGHGRFDPEDLSPETMRSLKTEFESGGFPRVLARQLDGVLADLPADMSTKLAVAEPVEGSGQTLGFEVTCDGQSGQMTRRWPRPRLETRADRVIGTLGGGFLLRVHLTSPPSRNKASASRCHTCGSTDHWARDCPSRGGTVDAHGIHQARLERDAEEREEQRAHERKQLELLKGGLSVCDRHYEFLGFKDAGDTKEQLWFWATDGPAADVAAGSSWLPVEQALARLAPFEACATVPKMAARIELAFSGTTPFFHECTPFRVWRSPRETQAGSWTSIEDLAASDEFRRVRAAEEAAGGIDAGTIHVVELDDIFGAPAPSAASQQSAAAVGAPNLMTDGGGCISHDLAKQIADECDVPLVSQVRLWYHGSVAKGTLTTSAALPRRTIVVRSSQIKVDGGGGADGGGAGRCALELVRVQGPKPSSVQTGPFLVPLLEHVAPAVVGELKRMQRLEAESTRTSERLVASGRPLSEAASDALLRMFELLPERPSDPQGAVQTAQMFLAGMDTSDEHLRNKVLDLLRSQLNELAKGRVPIPKDAVGIGGANLMAVPDPSETLPEGTVCVLIGGEPQMRERALLYKPPGIHPGDVRTVRAVPPTQELLRHLDFGSVGGSMSGKTGLIISTRGSRSLADMIAGSDMDGDVFQVVFNQDLLSHWPATDAAPWEPPPGEASSSLTAPPPRRPNEMEFSERQDRVAAHFFVARASKVRMREIATKWKAWADKEGSGSRQAKQLSGLYMLALDGAKTGKEAKIPWELRSLQLPRHLHKTAKARVESQAHTQRGERGGGERKSALLQLWQAITCDESTLPPACTGQPLHLDEELQYVHKYDRRGVKETKPFLPEPQRQNLRDKWERHWAQYARQMEDRRNKSTSDGWYGYMRELQPFREHFLSGRNPNDPTDELRAEAGVLYEVVYTSRAGRTCGRCASCLAQSRSRRSYTFVWNVCGDVLLDLKVQNRLRKSNNGRAPLAVDQAILARRLRLRKRAAAALQQEEEALYGLDDHDEPADLAPIHGHGFASPAHLRRDPET
jgi:hypothetical protein